MNVLLLYDQHVMKHKLDRNRLHSMKAVADLVLVRGGKVERFGPSFRRWRDDESAAINVARVFPNIKFDLVWAYGVLFSCANIASHVVVACNELFEDEFCQRLLSIQPTYVVLHHTNEVSKLPPELPWVHIPHAAEHTIFCPNSKVLKQYDFLLVGYAKDIETYPLRHKLLGVCTQLNRRGYRVHVHQHPGYKLTDPFKAVQDYINVIRKAKVVMTCSSFYRYRLSKMAEIPMCGAALATDMPHDGADFFRQFIIELDPKAKIDEHCQVLIQGLKAWEQRAERGRQLTLNTSTQEHYARRFLQAYSHVSNVTLALRVLLVVDVKGWAWDHKARNIRKFYNGPHRIDICTEAEYKNRTNAPFRYDHIHFFSIHAPCAVSKERVRQGLLRVSVTIASYFDFVHTDVTTLRRNLRHCDIVTVSPYLTDECRRMNMGRSVIPCFNGVDTSMFVPSSSSSSPKLRVLICNKPRPPKYDAHGYDIAYALTQRFKDHPTIAITFHVANHKSKNLLPQNNMVPLYQQHDVFVHCGRRHLGTPNMAFEAAACGLAIVSTAQGCLPALFGERDHLLVPLPEPLDLTFPNKDKEIVEALATHLEALDGDRDLLQTHKDMAYHAIFEDKWRWEDRAQDYAQAFDLPCIDFPLQS